MFPTNSLYVSGCLYVKYMLYVSNVQSEVQAGERDEAMVSAYVSLCGQAPTQPVFAPGLSLSNGPTQPREPVLI